MSRPPTRTAILLALLTLVLLAPGERARAEALAADLSKHLIAITTAFVGTEVVLFGTSDGQGDIVVTVHGPRQDTVGSGSIETASSSPRCPTITRSRRAGP
jgi:hypothetical protein